MENITERKDSYQVKWRNRHIRDNEWQVVPFPHTRMGLADARRLVEFVWHPLVARRIAKDDPRIVNDVFLHGTHDEKFSVFTAPAGPTLADLAEKCLAAKRRADSTVNNNRSRLRQVPDWMCRPVSEITPAANVVKFHELVARPNRNGGTLRPAYATLTLKTVWMVLRWAVSERLVTLTLDDGTSTSSWTVYREALMKHRDEMVHASPAPEAALDQDHYWALINLAVDPVLRATLRILGECGLRVGEVLALNVADVDVNRAILRVRSTMAVKARTDDDPVKRRAGEGVFRRPGTKGSKLFGTPKAREVPLSSDLLALLLTVIDNRHRDSPLLVVNGDRVSKNWVKRHLSRLQEAVCGHDSRWSEIRVHPHLFRHSYATWAAPYVSSLALMTLLGHRDLKMIVDRYYHGQGAADEARKAANFLASARKHSPTTTTSASDQSLNQSAQAQENGTDDAQAA